MRSRMRIYLIPLAILIALLVGVLYFVTNQTEEVYVPVDTPAEIQEEEADPRVAVIGTSVLGRTIEAYTYGDGERHLLFVGGIHGGYEWNSVLLAYRFIDYFSEFPDAISPDTTVTIIPALNPDGVFKVIGKEGRFALGDVPVDEGVTGNGRFNANGVDLNRNFDCKWQPESTWRGNTVSAGTEPFSEPEAKALRDLVLKERPEAVVFWHSQANAVYASECEDGVLPETLTLMNTYADAAGYASVPVFDAYPVTGDAEGWLASIGIPAVTVELRTHETIEWEKNHTGVMEILATFAK